MSWLTKICHYRNDRHFIYKHYLHADADFMPLRASSKRNLLTIDAIKELRLKLLGKTKRRHLITMYDPVFVNNTKQSVLNRSRYFPFFIAIRRFSITRICFCIACGANQNSTIMEIMSGLNGFSLYHINTVLF